MVHDKKEASTFTNVEHNVYRGLHDFPTLAEACVLSLYSQTITYPYLHIVRGSEGKKTSAVDLGTLHNKLLKFYAMATFDSKLWECPEAFYAVHQLLPTLQHVDQLLVAFFEGALETWSRFLAEFNEGGDISLATEKERERVSLPATNDFNEGGLGRLKRAKRRAPNMTTHQHEARDMYRFNNTAEFIKKLPVTAMTQVRAKARIADSSRIEATKRHNQAVFDRDEAEKNREKIAKKQKKAAEHADAIAKIVVKRLEEINEKLKVTEIDEQIAWHRHRLGPKVLKIPGRATKVKKLEVLWEIARTYWATINEENVATLNPRCSSGSASDVHMTLSVGTAEDFDEESDYSNA